MPVQYRCVYLDITDIAGATDITPCQVHCEDVPKVWFDLELKKNNWW